MSEHKNAPEHTFCKAGIFYFRRRVPRDLSCHYTSSQIAFSLRTRSAAVAAARATRAAQRLDERRYHLRVKERDLPGKHLLRMQQAGTVPVAWSATAATESAFLKLSEAVAIYLKLKGVNRPVTFTRAAERSCGYVIEICGDKDLFSYTKVDATRLRDALIERGLQEAALPGSSGP